MAERWTWLTRTACVAAVVLGLLAILEAGLRLFDYRPARGLFPSGMFTVDAELGYVPTPDFEATLARREFTARIRQKPDAPSPDRPDRSDEVLVVGDSFVHGYFVDADQTLPARLAAALGVPCRNLGVMGYGPEQELDYYKRQAGPPGQGGPGRVLWVVNFTDLLDLLIHARSTVALGEVVSNPPGSLVPPAVRALLLKARICYLAGDAFSALRALAEVGIGTDMTRGLGLAVLTRVRPWDMPLPAFAAAYEGPLAQAAERFEAIIGAFAREAHRRGAALTMTVAPSRYAVEPGLWERAVTRFGLDPGQYDPAAFDAFACRAAARQGVPCLDLLPVLRAAGGTLFYPLDGHWNARAIEAAAAALAAWPALQNRAAGQTP